VTTPRQVTGKGHGLLASHYRASGYCAPVTAAVQLPPRLISCWKTREHAGFALRKGGERVAMSFRAFVEYLEDESAGGETSAFAKNGIPPDQL